MTIHYIQSIHHHLIIYKNRANDPKEHDLIVLKLSLPHFKLVGNLSNSLLLDTKKIANFVIGFILNRLTIYYPPNNINFS